MLARVKNAGGEQINGLGVMLSDKRRLRGLAVGA
jgi:hypothetical protein